MTLSCISFDSYIKPQLFSLMTIMQVVVYLLIPTSNHNVKAASVYCAKVVYLLIPTSNHNIFIYSVNATSVVYLLIPTSNHNTRLSMKVIWWLYIF